MKLATCAQGGTYNTGCRCPECKRYQRERVAANRADRLAAGRLSHGRRSARDAGCTCPRCLPLRRGANR